MAPGRSAFYVSNNERDQRFFDLSYDTQTYIRTLLYKNELQLDLGPISRDERWLALNRTNTTSDSDIYLFDIAKQEIQHLTPHDGRIRLSRGDIRPRIKKAASSSPTRGPNSRTTYDLLSG